MRTLAHPHRSRKSASVRGEAQTENRADAAKSQLATERAETVTMSPPPDKIRAQARVKLLVLGRYHLFRECLATLLAELGDFSVDHQAIHLPTLVDTVEELCPDVLLIDLARMEDLSDDRVFDLIRTVRQYCADVKMILLGVGEVETELLRFVEEGVNGYVSKSSSAEELRSAIELVMHGQAVCPPRLAFTMFHRLTELSREQQRRRRVEALALTPREMEVLQLIADGLSNQKIADRLSLSIYTVKNHVHHVLDKLQVKRRSEAVERAHQRRWLR